MKMLDPKISRKLNDLIERELQKGESISFIETPQPRFFTTRSTAEFLFAIPWTLFSLFWIVFATGFKIPDFRNGFDLFPLFGIPFVLIGFALLSSPIRTYRNAFQSVYVITNLRAITFVGGFRTTIRSFFPHHFDGLRRTEKSDGSGDVIITTMTQLDSDNDAHHTHLGFLGVANAKASEDRLRELASTLVPR